MRPYSNYDEELPTLKKDLQNIKSFIVVHFFSASFLIKLCFVMLFLSVASLITASSRIPTDSVYSKDNGDTTQAVEGPVVEPDMKYFQEPGISGKLSHYDGRYYSGAPVSDNERVATLHHMTRSYLTTFQKLNIETWLAHGTLLGWWWNGRMLPWDRDIDVQVSASTLSFLAEHFNHTVHEYEVKEAGYEGGGLRKYLLDINPYSREREHGDGANVIDARWIDLSNGLFIDITGIAELDPIDSPNRWSDKNGHVYDTDEIWPIRTTEFEGSVAWVPSNYEQVLIAEYDTKALTETTWEGHTWNATSKVWAFDPSAPQPGEERKKPSMLDLSPGGGAARRLKAQKFRQEKEQREKEAEEAAEAERVRVEKEARDAFERERIRDGSKEDKKLGRAIW